MPFTEDPWQWFQSLIMPWFVLAAAFAAFYARLLRGNLIEVMSEDYIRTARAKGLSRAAGDLPATACAARSRRSSPLLGLDIGILLGGAILTETVFNIPGIGRLAYDAISARRPADDPGHRAVRRVLHRHREPVVDVLYAFLDPRVRY